MKIKTNIYIPMQNITKATQNKYVAKNTLHAYHFQLYIIELWALRARQQYTL